MTTSDILFHFIIYLGVRCCPDCMFAYCGYTEQWHKSQRSRGKKCIYSSKLIMVYNTVKLVIK